MNFPPMRLLLVLFLVVPLLAAQETKDKDEPTANLPVEQWLSGPDRQDFKWKVEITSPRLTYQQRNLVQVRANVDVPTAQGSQRHDLFFVMKVADETGKWLTDGSYNHYPLAAGFDTKKSAIQYSTGLYIKPGKYTAALLLFDAVSGRGNVWHKPFEVHAPKPDMLPNMDRDIPVIEFIPDVPNDAVSTQASDYVVLRGARRVPFGGSSRAGVSGVAVLNEVTDEEWSPGHGTEFLPVRVARPLRVDVVLNVAPSADPNQRRRNSVQRYRSVAGSMLQAGAVLSHLDVEPGCVRVSAIDLSNLAIVFDRIDGQTANWDKLTEQVHKIDHNTVSVRLLGDKNATSEFLRETMSRLLGDGTGCGSGNTDRAVLIVSHDFEFPSGVHADVLEEPCRCRLIHLRIGSPGVDDIEKFLKPANPQRTDARTPEQFRHALAEIMEQLSGGAERQR